jgi:hypothetical protein
MQHSSPALTGKDHHELLSNGVVDGFDLCFLNHTRFILF